MKSYYVVRESHTFEDDKVSIEVPEKEDVLGWVSQRLNSMMTAMQMDMTMRLQEKGDKDSINKSLTLIGKDMTTMRKNIGSLSEQCEQDFRQIIEDSFSSQLDSFAQQIQRVESLLEEVKVTLSKAEAIKRELEKYKASGKK